MQPLLGKSKILVIDGDYMLHRMLHNPKLQEMSTKDGVPTGGVFGFLKSMRAAVQSLSETSKIILVFDGGHSKRRSEIFPGYRVRPPIEDKIQPGVGKVSKDEDGIPYHEVFGHQKKFVREWVSAMGYQVLSLPGKEADDIIYQLVAADQGKSLIVIVSDDKDFYQLLSDSVHVYRILAEEYVGPSKFQQQFKFPVKKYLLYKAFIGDPSDMTPGIRGIGPASATEIVSAISHPREVKGYCENHRKKAFRAVVSPENIEILKRNLRLFNVRKEEFDEGELRKIRKALVSAQKSVDWGTLKRIASELEIASLGSNLSQWMRPFQVKS